MTVDFIRTRIAQLMGRKNLTAYQLSYDLGHNKNYISTIINGKSLPSFGELFYLCEYFNITVSQFFDMEDEHPILRQEAIQGILKLKEPDLIATNEMIKRLIEK